LITLITLIVECFWNVMNTTTCRFAACSCRLLWCGQLTGYGKIDAGEAAMQQEILARGPITCGIACPENFVYHYHSSRHNGGWRLCAVKCCLGVVAVLAMLSFPSMHLAEGGMG